MRARRLLEEGDPASATAVLDSIQAAEEDPTVRAALRQTALNVHWRTGDIAAMVVVLDEILSDAATPPLLRDIALIFRDASSLSSRPLPLAVITKRLTQMATRQKAGGLDYYAAISTHNAAVMALHSGRLIDARFLASEAMRMYAEMSIRPPEYYSTSAVLAHISLELGQRGAAEEYLEASLASGSEDADVPAILAYLTAVVGDRQRAQRFLASADELERAGRSDMSAKVTAAMARAILTLPNELQGVLAGLELAPDAFPLDVEADELVALRALTHLLALEPTLASKVVQGRLPMAKARGSRLAEVRLTLLGALATEKPDQIRIAIEEAASVSHLALLEVADAIGTRLHLTVPVPMALERSIEEWPERWLPVLRRSLDLGDDPTAHVAARLLDRFGAAVDVGRLRAYEKVYRRRAVVAGLGKALARRVSPRLEIHDLGQGSFTIGGREVRLSRIRRRSGAVLMYLVSRPNLTATREQIIEDIWPDGDVSAGANSLNQSLYFLRREIDPWYEDDISPEYVSFASELVSLDPELVSVDSVGFIRGSRDLMAATMGIDEARTLLDTYRGQFAPEFEYEDWAISWRARVHAAFLDFARSSVEQFSKAGELKAACDVCLRVLSVDPDAADIERCLIWLYWRSGATSAAETQYAHFAGRERRDGLTATSLAEIIHVESLAS
jgi:DNA-binding SARP family transcriptional activator